MRLRNAALATFIACAPATALAQQKQEPRRPVLVAGADTNDAHAYYGFAIERLTKEPQKAADALYWATRLDPTWADAFYARWVAMMLTDVTRYQLYSSGDRRAVAEAKAIDSLLFRALTLNPFVPRRLERKLFDATLEEIALRAARGRTSSGNVRFEMELAMQKWPAYRRARFAHGDGQFEQALGLYSIAIEKDQKDFGLRLDRGRLLFEMGRFEGALLDLQSAMEDIKKQQEKDLVFFYRSRAVTEHSIAVVHQKLGNTAAAKEAFGRALEQDLAYYPAHLQLANIALDAKDTTAALAELALATQLRPDDAAAQFLHGFTLLRAGNASEGDAHLRKSIELNPVYAAPKFLHARLLESADFREEAIDAYKAFLAAAARTDPTRVEAETRLAALTRPPQS